MSVRSVVPDNLGWLEYDLSKDELDYVWKCIDENEKESITYSLAGNLKSSFSLGDPDDFFFNNCIVKLLTAYADTFKNLGQHVPMANTHPYYMNSWWVNYQKQHEFNPIHNHGGVYSFVIFMKIPIDFKEQNMGNVTNTPLRSAFQFSYTNIMGEIQTDVYKLSSKDEGLMLFFPSHLNHQVYPFYNCDEERITVSGNVSINTNKTK